MPAERRKRAVPIAVPRPLEKRLESQAYEVMDSVASSLFKKYGYLARKGRVSIKDFRQHAFIGVMKAYAKFDESRGVEFKKFAFAKASGEVLSMLRERVPMVYVPAGVLRQVSSEEAFNQSISRLHEIALKAKTHGEYNSAMKKIAALRSARNGIRPLSGDKPVGSRGKDLQHAQTLFDVTKSRAKWANAFDTAVAKDLHQYLSTAFNKYLDRRTARVLRLRYLSEEPMPMRAIAEILGVCPAMVSKIHNEGLLELLNEPKFKRALGLPEEKVFSKKDIGAITTRLGILMR